MKNNRMQWMQIILSIGMVLLLFMGPVGLSVALCITKASLIPFTFLVAYFVMLYLFIGSKAKNA